MSMQYGRLVFPKCKNININLIFVEVNGESEIMRAFNSFQRINNNGNISWNFGLFIDDSFHENTEFKEYHEGNIKTEEEVKQIYLLWICPKVQFTMESFINGGGWGFTSNNFYEFLPKLYESKDFSNKILIDSSNYSKIYSAYSIKAQKEVCLKVIDLDNMKLIYKKYNLKDYRRDLNNEINILTILTGNENSVEYYGSFDKENEKIIVMEKCDINLKEFMEKKGHALTIEEIKKNFISINNIFKIMQKS